MAGRDDEHPALSRDLDPADSRREVQRSRRERDVLSHALGSQSELEVAETANRGHAAALACRAMRSGTDVVKALALGATAVGIGRPYAYGLALGGIEGIVHVLRSILAEADLLMAVDGYPTRASLDEAAMRRL